MHASPVVRQGTVQPSQFLLSFCPRRLFVVEALHILRAKNCPRSKHKVRFQSPYRHMKGERDRAWMGSDWKEGK